MFVPVSDNHIFSSSNKMFTKPLREERKLDKNLRSLNIKKKIKHKLSI